MKIITKYQAKNGIEFDTEAECIEHEALIDECERIMSVLKPRPAVSGCDFENGLMGYIQQDESVFLAVKNSLLDIATRYSNHLWITETRVDASVHPSYVGRLLDDFGHRLRPLQSAWARISNTDSKYREWGQGCFRNNPDKAPVQTAIA